MIALSATLLLAPAAQAQTPPLAAGEIARVADAPILKTTYDHWHEVAKISTGEKDPDETQLRNQVMQLLIGFQWIEGEAARKHIVVRPGAVYTNYKRQREESFRTEAEFQKFLKDSGQTVADIKLRVRQDMLSSRIRDKVVAPAKTPKGQMRLLDRFLKSFAKRWKAQTVCGKGYEIDDCGTVVPLST